jgi:hypothetical protein
MGRESFCPLDHDILGELGNRTLAPNFRLPPFVYVADGCPARAFG